MAEACIARAMWDRHKDQHDLETAQGRAALDQALRAELQTIEDECLRQHATEMLRRIRWLAFYAGTSEADVRNLARRIAAIEAYLGLEPRQAGGACEVVSLRRYPGNE